MGLVRNETENAVKVATMVPEFLGHKPATLEPLVLQFRLMFLAVFRAFRPEFALAGSGV